MRTLGCFLRTRRRLDQLVPEGHASRALRGTERMRCIRLAISSSLMRYLCSTK